VRLSLLPLLACPDCRSDLRFAQGDPAPNGTLINGIIECVGCRRSFVVQKRIPQLLPKHLDPLLKHQMGISDSEAEDYDNNLTTMAFGIAEIPYTIAQLQLSPSDVLLEAACGTGRMSERLVSRVGQLVSVDLSYKSLLVNEIKLEATGHKNFDLIQADLGHLPLKDSLFDRVLASQILGSLPNDQLRLSALAEIKRAVKPAGEMVISAYRYSNFTKVKFGEFENGLTFFRFTEQEFADLLQTSLMLKSISGLLIYMYVARCLKSDSPVASSLAA
jgi:ubiquinone/menaquinone biosynthesis C-methylase UbiE/uncharacterized protein YbaR (Trm112 family)